MPRVHPIPSAAVLFLLMGAAVSAQLTPTIGFGTPRAKPSAAIPATPPTSASSMPMPTAAAVSTQKPTRRPEVTFVAGLLSVKADNSSLNQILREIARTTGLKITGGVAEERVFGKYGPASIPDVLSMMLDGTASNMLLISSDTTTPGELVLTPRHGGPTPPNPNAPGFEDEEGGQDVPPPAFVPQGQRGAIPGLVMPGETGSSSQPEPNVPPLATSPGSVPPTATSTAPPTATGTGTSPTDPNAIKTPQQIYEQLQRLRQQMQQPTPQ